MMEMEAGWASFNLMSLWTKAILMNGRGLDGDGVQSSFNEWTWAYRLGL